MQYFLIQLQASILQQTAEYIYSLEQEKTRLLSQNCHLKRLLDQHEGGAGSQEINQITLPKKRKIEGGIVVQAISDSSDEGLGNMSPEHVPVSFVTVVSSKNPSQQGHTTIQVTAKDFIEMKQQLEVERKQRQRLEDQLRQLECQLYPDRTVHYQEVIEHTDGLREGEEMTIIEQPVNKISLSQLKSLHHGDMENVLLSLESIPSVGQTQVVVCSPVGELVEENSRPISPSDLVQTDEIKQEKIIITTEKRSHLPQARVVSSILEAAIKAEPKVEVERIDAPATIVIEEASAGKSRHGSPAPQSRMYVTNTSRQNLETIVEAIRHLEGDHLFEEVQVDQEVPLALTTKQARDAQREREHRKIQLEINPFLKFNTSSSTPTSSVTVIPATVSSSHSQTSKTVTIQQQQVNRPGVIVVKQASS